MLSKKEIKMDNNEENVNSENLKKDYKDALKNLINLAEESLENQDFDSAKVLLQSAKKLIELQDLVDIVSDWHPRGVSDELDEPDEPDEFDDPDEFDELDEPDESDVLYDIDALYVLNDLDELDEINPSEDQKKPLKGRITPKEKFVIPILESIIELGGKAIVKDVLKLVYPKMKGILKSYDYELYESYPSGMILELWEKSVQHAKNMMVNKGLIAKNTPKGIWAITEKGKKFYEENKKSMR